MWKDILTVGQRGGNFLGLFMANAKIVVGDGHKIRFWIDVWLGGASLKSLFLRIFGICTQKSIVVSEGFFFFLNLMRGVVLQ